MPVMEVKSLASEVDAEEASLAMDEETEAGTEVEVDMVPPVEVTVVLAVLVVLWDWTVVSYVCLLA